MLDRRSLVDLSWIQLSSKMFRTESEKGETSLWGWFCRGICYWKDGTSLPPPLFPPVLGRGERTPPFIFLPLCSSRSLPKCPQLLNRGGGGGRSSKWHRPWPSGADRCGSELSPAPKGSKTTVFTIISKMGRTLPTPLRLLVRILG